MMKDDDFKLLRGFADRLTDGRTDGRTLVIVKLDMLPILKLTMDLKTKQL